MRCSTVRTLLDDHVDGILPADRSQEVRAHMDACSTCDQELELLRAVTAPLSAWGDLEPPAGCFDRIMDRIEALPPEMHIPVSETPQPSLRFLRGGARWLVTSGAAAAAVLVAAVALDRAGDITTPHPARDQVRNSVVGVRPTNLKPGEIPLTRARFEITDDLEQNDGLRRRRRRNQTDLPRDLSIPVSADPLGAGSR